MLTLSRGGIEPPGVEASHSGNMYCGQRNQYSECFLKEMVYHGLKMKRVNSSLLRTLGAEYLNSLLSLVYIYIYKTAPIPQKL